MSDEEPASKAVENLQAAFRNLGITAQNAARQIITAVRYPLTTLAMHRRRNTEDNRTIVYAPLLPSTEEEIQQWFWSTPNPTGPRPDETVVQLSSPQAMFYIDEAQVDDNLLNEIRAQMDEYIARQVHDATISSTPPPPTGRSIFEESTMTHFDDLQSAHIARALADRLVRRRTPDHRLTIDRMLDRRAYRITLVIPENEIEEDRIDTAEVIKNVSAHDANAVTLLKRLLYHFDTNPDALATMIGRNKNVSVLVNAAKKLVAVPLEDQPPELPPADPAAIDYKHPVKAGKRQLRLRKKSD